MSLFLAPIHPRVWGESTVTSIPEWLKTDHPREVIEAAYARSDLFERRRILMDDWARYLAQATRDDSKPGYPRGPWILPEVWETPGTGWDRCTLPEVFPHVHGRARPDHRLHRHDRSDHSHQFFSSSTKPSYRRSPSLTGATAAAQ